MTIDQIAKLAKVSKSAVSLALNNKPGVSEATRNTILEIAKANGYIPRVMIKADQVYDPVKVIRVVAFAKQEVVHEGYHHEPFFSELISGLEEENRKQGYTLFFSTIRGNHFLSELQSLEQEFQSRGILVIGTNLSEEEALMIYEAYPTSVILDTCYPHIPGNFVVMNNLLGGSQAAKYLISQGHRSIGYVESNVRINNFDERKRAFIHEIERNGLALLQSNVFQVSPIMEKAQNEFFFQLERRDKMPTVLFCESDNIAIGVLKALQKHGLSVPEDISIMGFDNIPHCTIVSPTLTSIRVEKDVMGSEAIKKLIQLIEVPHTHQEASKSQDSLPPANTKIIIDTTISERESVKSLV